MRGGFLGIFIGLTLALGTILAPTAPAGVGLAAPVSGPQDEVIAMVNAERAKAGLNALTYNASLAASATAYAVYMARANFFGHVGPDGSTLASRDAAAGYTRWSWVGENLAAGQPNAAAAMAGWMASPGHRANILATSAREIGVGFATGGSYGYYWAQEFGARPSAPPPPQRPTTPAPQSAGPSARQQPASPSSRSSRPAAELPITMEVPSWTSDKTGFAISGDWLTAYKLLGGLDALGEPRSGVIKDPEFPGQEVQYFQRGVLELHPENPAPYRIQRRLIGDLLFPTNEDAASPDEAPPEPATYFPFSSGAPMGLGHFVSDYTRTGAAIFFKDFFDRNGGIDSFGFPKEEPVLRDGVWTQRFQAALFRFHTEYDGDGLIPGTNVPYRNYRVQLALLGDQYVESIDGINRHPLGWFHAPVNLAKDAES